MLGLAERQLPADPTYVRFLREQAPDALLVSPLVHFGSAQADLVAGARSLGIPVGMLLYSWDNLSTKGCLHQPPDRMFVWNELQRQEALTLHGFPEDRVVVAGAPRFDAFFELRPQTGRDEFYRPLGLDPAQATILYACSSRFVSANELVFIRKWLAAVRASPDDRLRRSNVIVRPHPDITMSGQGPLDREAPGGRRAIRASPPSGDTTSSNARDAVRRDELGWPSLPGVRGLLSRPFGDDHAVVLRTSDRVQRGLYECLEHCDAVVGLNTSAELEAAIVGRPVFTVVADEADGQASTLHFHYLIEAEGGVVRVAHALDEHTRQLALELAAPRDRTVFRAFAAGFLRPRGVDHAVSPLLAEAIEQAFADWPRAEARGDGPAKDAEGLEPRVERVPSTPVGDEVGVTARKYAYALRMRSAGEMENGHRRRFDRDTVEWLRRQVGVGDTVYDVDAGDGLYTLVAARHHGAVVVAFEPGYAAFQALCENLQLNGCDGLVVPLPLALADFEGVGDLKYPAGRAGRHRHVVKPTRWHPRRSARDERGFRQPVCAVPLDLLRRRYELPAPNHLRMANPDSAAAVLRGATETLALPSMRTIFLTIAAEEGDDIAARLEPGWHVVSRTALSRGRVHLVLARSPIGDTRAAATL
jgi:FkbM family methyltransferase